MFFLSILYFLLGLVNLAMIFPELSSCDKLFYWRFKVERVSQHIRINSEVSKITALYTT